MDAILKSQFMNLYNKIDRMRSFGLSDEEIEKSFDSSDLETIEKARSHKYIRKEGDRYIYEEPKSSGFKQIKGDEVWGEKWRKKSKEEIEKEIDYLKKELKDNPNNIGKTNDNFKRKLDYLVELKQQSENKKDSHEISFKNPDGSEGKRTIKIGNVSEKEAIDWAKEHIKGSDFKVNKSLENDIEKSITAFSEEDRKKLAKKGEAMPDGSFPIRNKQDVKDAARQWGRAKDPEAAKAHIIKRAKALGAESDLPEKWDVQEKAEEDQMEKGGGEAKVAKVMKEFKEGKLKSSSGEVVTDRDQAIAIAMSEAGLDKKK